MRTATIGDKMDVGRPLSHQVDLTPIAGELANIVLDSSGGGHVSASSWQGRLDEDMDSLSNQEAASKLLSVALDNLNLSFKRKSVDF